jgi:glyoxylase-like metal-dependent hydrolase (beta-lactamase superfamily II)
MEIPLEDTAADIIGKAQRGLGMSDTQLAEKSGVNAQQIRRLREGDFDEASLAAMAPVLGVDAASLTKLARNEWQPERVEPVDGLAQFNTTYGDMTVNAYLVWDPAARVAVAFDTGADCSEMLERIRNEKLTVQLILLTHSHPDHIADLDRLREATGAPVYLSQREEVAGAKPMEDGKRFECGALRIESRLTSGHSAGGTTFVVTGLALPIAVVGDSLFAASMGGGAVSYQDAVRNNREQILTLPNETIVCPGHGPLTTVGKEKRENPFFAQHR